MFPDISREGIDLLEKMLQWDPTKRITVTEALKHPFLSKWHDESDEPTCLSVYEEPFAPDADLTKADFRGKGCALNTLLFTCTQYASTY